jgi:stage II sporulation protein D
VAGKVRQRSYRGILRILTTGDGNVRVINVLPVELYVAGVVANELVKTWHLEAYKAQAVAARSYALSERATRTAQDFDVYDSTLSQVYGGLDTETPTALEAVNKTRGIVTAYRGANGKVYLMRALYHSTCGGGTVPAGRVFGGPTSPPLAGGVQCTFCAASPRYRWADVVLTKAEIGEALVQSGLPALTLLKGVAGVKVTSTIGPGGRVETIRIDDGRGQFALLSAGQFRSLIGAGRIFSNWFTIEDDGGDTVRITGGRGYGHGVGLCQWGAQYLAEHGQTGEQILRYYYPGVELLKAY